MSCDDCDDKREPEIHTEPDAPEARPGVPRLTLHIDLPDLDPEVIRNAVVETALNRYVLERTVTTRKRTRMVQARDGNGQPVGSPMPVEVEEPVQGGWAFQEVIRKEVCKQITDQLQPLLHEILDRQVAEILAEEIQPTDQWGTPKGPKIRIRELIRTTLDSYVREKVDGNGRHESGSYGKPRVEWAIIQASDKVFKEAVAPVVEQVKKELTATLAGRTKEAIAQAALNALGIRG